MVQASWTCVCHCDFKIGSPFSLFLSLPIPTLVLHPFEVTTLVLPAWILVSSVFWFDEVSF